MAKNSPLNEPLLFFYNVLFWGDGCSDKNGIIRGNEERPLQLIIVGKTTRTSY